MSTINEDEELSNLRTLFRSAFRNALILVALTVALAKPAMSYGLLFVYYIWLPLLALYFLAQVIWFGVPLLVHEVPRPWKSGAQATIVLLLWSIPFVYFAQVPSTLESIAPRAGVWPLALASLVLYVAHSSTRMTADHDSARPFLIATACITLFSFMTKEAGGESTEPLTSPDELAYWVYVLFSVVAFGGIIVGRRYPRSPRSGA